MTGRGRSWLALTVAVATATAALLALPESVPASDGRAARGVDALAFEPVSSPVLRALRHRLGSRMKVRRATRARLRRPRRYEALIVDGHSSTPRELARRAGRLRRFLDAGASVVAFDVGSAHHKRALYDLTGFRAAPARGKHFSRVALFRRVVSDGVPRMSIIDARRLLPYGSGRLSGRQRNAARRQQARRLAAMVGGKLLAAKHPLTPAPTRPVATAAQATTPLPPELQHTSASFTFTGGRVMPRPTLAGNGGRCDCPDFPVHPVYVRVRPQTAWWKMTHTLDVYLDNATTPGGDFQVVAYRLDGEVDPTAGQFAIMDDKFGWAGVFKRQEFNLERAWWTGIADASVGPDVATGAKLSLKSRRPTGEALNFYTAGEAFEVGYRLARARGPGVAVNAGVGQLQNHDMHDWGVVDQTTGNTPKWEFSARNGCDVRQGSYTAGGCFDTRFGSAGTPNRPNALSLGNLKLHGSSRWQTTSLLKDSSSGTLNFATAVQATLADTYCTGWGVAACSGYGVTRFPDPNTCRGCGPFPPDSHNVQVDVSAVVPVGIKDVTFDDANADGSSGERVKGTVTLNSPSKLLGGTNVVIYSDSRNAVVGDLIGSGPQSTTTVVVPKDQTSATFDIVTNDIGLQAGASATANITAFYAQPTRAQLKVKATPPPQGQPSDHLNPEQRLKTNERLASRNGKFELILQSDGNLVSYPIGSSAAVWASDTVGMGAAYARMQSDGNFVLYTAQDKPVWATGTVVNQPAYVKLENDGKLVVYALTGKVLWQRPS